MKDSVVKTVPLGDVVDVIGGGTPSKRNPAFYGGEIPWATIRDMNVEHLKNTEHSITPAGLKGSSAKIIPAGEIVVATRVGLGKVCILGQATAINQDLRGLVPKSDVDIDRRFLFHWYASIADKVIEAGTGATVQGVKLPFVKSLPFPALSLQEQQRIVAVLDEAFEGLARARAHAEANLQNARELSSAAVEAVFNRLPASTLIEELRNLCTERGITYGVIKLGDHDPKGVPCLRTSNVRPLRIDVDGMKVIAPNLSNEYSRTILQGGEVLVNVRGTLGGVATVPDHMAGWNISREVAMLPVDHSRLDPDFASFFLSTRGAQAWLTGVVKGAAYKGINLTDLRLLRIPVPGLDVQAEIAREIVELRLKTQAVEDFCAAKLEDLDDLRRSLLQKAFAGELA
ncbi:restriction endonuclease subunit S [uncultured Sulfitobacter sp.]|uniref:restriction endonuclease subunit S n=1 Tax=uncultured Sulfitobacter sp. TaxID=191468 RepID=UPI0025921447|nr:restriction endonuclease subunit S [uncultured Sulfitobacter sp.]